MRDLGGRCVGWRITNTARSLNGARCGCCGCTIPAGGTAVFARAIATGRRAVVCDLCAGRTEEAS